MRRSMGEYTPEFISGRIQRVVRELAHHQCEICAMDFQQGTNIAISARNVHGKPMIGTVHYLDYDRSNNDMSNLTYLCQKCHFTIHLCWWRPSKPLPKCMHTNLAAFCKKRGIHYPEQLSIFGESNE